MRLAWAGLSIPAGQRAREPGRPSGCPPPPEASPLLFAGDGMGRGRGGREASGGAGNRGPGLRAAPPRPAPGQALATAFQAANAASIRRRSATRPLGGQGTTLVALACREGRGVAPTWASAGLSPARGELAPDQPGSRPGWRRSRSARAGLSRRRPATTPSQRADPRAGGWPRSWRCPLSSPHPAGRGYLPALLRRPSRPGGGHRAGRGPGRPRRAGRQGRPFGGAGQPGRRAG